MKRIFTFALSVLGITVLSLSGCTKSPDEDQNSDNKVAINIGTQIYSRVNNANWDDNDVIGITMFNQNTTTLTVGNYVNQPYIVTSGVSDNFQPLNNSSIIYFPINGSNVTLLSYYPYTSAMTSSYVVPLDVSDQSVLKKIDFMTAQHTAGFNKSNPNVELLFTHQLSKVIINLQQQTGDPASRLIGSTITLKGMPTTGSYDLINPTPSVAINTGSVADINIPTDITGANATGIVFPRAAAPGASFEINLTDGSTYTANIDPNLVFLPGYQYIFYITLNKTQINVSADIQPWTNGPDTYLNMLSVGTTPDASIGVTEGSVMKVYNVLGGYLTSFTYGSDGQWTTTSPYYWESILGSNATFRATIDAATPPDNQMADYLVADPVSVSRNNAINFTFRHVASKVNVALTSSDGTFTPSDLSGATITLPNYRSGGILLGGMYFPGISSTNISVLGGTALIQPQTINAGNHLVQIVIAGRTYYANAPAGGITFNAGEARLISIDMSKTALSVSATVVDWVTGEIINLLTRLVAISTPGTTSGFTPGSRIDMFLLNNGNTRTQYTLDGDGQTWMPIQPLYWDDIATLPIEIGAAYPSGYVVPTNKYVHWEIASNQSGGTTSSDLRIAYINSLALGQPANLVFKHAMNKLDIILIEGVGFAPGSLDNATVTINDMYTFCDVYLPTGSVSSLTIPTSITPYKTSNRNFSALIIPTSLTTGTEILNVMIGSNNYPVVLTGPMTFNGGQINTITITVNKTPIGISCTLENWTVGNNGNYVIE